MRKLSVLSLDQSKQQAFHCSLPCTTMRYHALPYTTIHYHTPHDCIYNTRYPTQFPISHPFPDKGGFHHFAPSQNYLPYCHKLPPTIRYITGVNCPGQQNNHYVSPVQQYQSSRPTVQYQSSRSTVQYQSSSTNQAVPIKQYQSSRSTVQYQSSSTNQAGQPYSTNQAVSIKQVNRTVPIKQCQSSRSTIQDQSSSANQAGQLYRTNQAGQLYRTKSMTNSKYIIKW